MAGGTGFGRWTGAPANLFAHTRRHVRPPVSGILRTEAAGVTAPLAACPVGELVHRPDVTVGSSGLKVRGRIFARLVLFARLVVKLPRQRYRDGRRGVGERMIRARTAAS